MHYAKEFVKYDAAMLDLLQSLDDAKDAEQAFKFEVMGDPPGLASGIENCEPEIAAYLEHKAKLLQQWGYSCANVAKDIRAQLAEADSVPQVKAAV